MPLRMVYVKYGSLKVVASCGFLKGGSLKHKEAYLRTSLVDPEVLSKQNMGIVREGPLVSK